MSYNPSCLSEEALRRLSGDSAGLLRDTTADERRNDCPGWFDGGKEWRISQLAEPAAFQVLQIVWSCLFLKQVAMSEQALRIQIVKSRGGGKTNMFCFYWSSRRV